MSGECDKKSKI